MTALEPPELGDMLISPYPYQVDAFYAVLREFRTVKSTLVVMPTGTGKTETALFVARCVIEEGGRVLFLAHTDELVNQPINKAIPVGLAGAKEKASDHACPHFTLADGTGSLYGHDDPRLVVASVQTLQGKRLLKWPPGHFDLIVTDEAHHATASTYRKVIDHLQPRWHLGVTATPDRGDGTPIVGKNQAFETLAFQYPLADAVAGGWLARPWFDCLNTAIDLKSLRVTGKDLNDADIEALLLPHVTEIVNELRPKLEGRRAVIFTPMVCSAQAVATGMQSLGVSTQWVSGDSPDRADVISEFKGGRYRHLVNAMVLTEGFDARFVDTVVILRATKSRSLFTQMAGRCLRTFPGKTEGLIVGVNWQTFGHKLVHPVEVFDGDAPPAVAARAKRLVDGGEESDLLAALKRAEAEERRDRERVRLHVEERAARARSVRFDPLAYDPDFAPAVVTQSGGTWELPPTGKQTALLEKLGWKPAEIDGWTKARATAEIGREFARRDKGLATRRQLKTLRSFRVPDAESLTKEQASALLDGLMGAKRVG